MRIRRKAFAFRLLTKVQQLLFGEPAFYKSAGINAGGRVALDIDQVATMLFCRSVPEMAKADVVERGRRLKARDMAAQFRRMLVSAQNNRDGVPANDRTNSVLDVTIPFGSLGALRKNRIDVGCRQRS